MDVYIHIYVFVPTVCNLSINFLLVVCSSLSALTAVGFEVQVQGSRFTESFLLPVSKTKNVHLCHPNQAVLRRAQLKWHPETCVLLIPSDPLLPPLFEIAYMSVCACVQEPEAVGLQDSEIFRA